MTEAAELAALHIRAFYLGLGAMLGGLFVLCLWALTSTFRKGDK